MTTFPRRSSGDATAADRVHLARDGAVALVGLLFSLWVTFASGYASVYQAMLLLLLGIPLYGFLKARRDLMNWARIADQGFMNARLLDIKFPT